MVVPDVTAYNSIWMVMCSMLLLLQPERIDPKRAEKGYTIQSDVWSFGITLVCVSFAHIHVI